MVEQGVNAANLQRRNIISDRKLAVIQRMFKEKEMKTEECYKIIDPSFDTNLDGKRQKVIDDIMNRKVLESYKEWQRRKK